MPFLTSYAIALCCLAAPRIDPPRIYDAVTVSHARIAFAFAGHLYDVARDGGTARQLTTTGGEHGFPLYSPDGTKLAFTRGGSLWVMPAEGGQAQRLTWYPRDVVPRAWTRDGSSILFVSARDGDGNMRAYTVPATGGPETLLPPHPVRFATYSPDGTRLAVVGHSPFTYGITRRHYRGGMRAPLTVIDPQTGHGGAVTRGTGNIAFPAWLGREIVFASDSLGSFNLVAYDTLTRRTRMLTRWRSHGITVAGDGAGAYVFARDGRLHVYDTATQQLTTVQVTMPAVADPVRRDMRVTTVQELAAGGGRVAAESRGDIIVFGADGGTALNLTRTTGVAERGPALSPDGQRVAYFSDASGEYALHVRAADGSGQVARIALGDAPTYFRGLSWSPDGTRLVFSDQRLVLWLADVAETRATPIDSSRWIAQGLWQTSWSGDGRLLAYARAEPGGMRTVRVRDTRSGATVQVSHGGSDDGWPVFDPTGRWLFFASSRLSGNAPARDVWSLMSDLQAQPLVSHTVMVTSLHASGALPVLPYGTGSNALARRPAAGALDLAGAATRIAPLGAAPRTIEGMWMGGDGGLLVQATTWPATGALDNAGRELLRIDPLTPRRATPLAPSVTEAVVASDGGSLLVRRSAGLGTITLRDTARAIVAVTIPDVTVPVDPRAEWSQMYHEAFRMMRDYFYDPAHHGVDVQALERHYAAWLPGLVRREQLNDLLLLAFGEISVSHLSIGGGALSGGGTPDDRVGVLGADFAVAGNRYRLARVIRNGPYQLSNSLARAPLDQPGAEFRVGEYLLAVNGRDVTTARPVDAHLEGTAGTPTTLRVGPAPDGAGARDIVVVPTIGENSLRRANWAEANRQEVERRSNGTVAYVYISGWSFDGMSELYRVLNSMRPGQGLIVDQRWNGGGITPDAAIDALQRVPWYRYAYRYGDGFGVPHNMVDGPRILLTNEANYSAAETFALMFKERRVGTIIGRRTGGGGIGGALYYQRLVDGGRVVIPNRASYNSRLGEWGIENHGVEPDIDIPLSFADAAAGRDPQLDRAIVEAMKARTTPRAIRTPPMPVHPPR